MLVDHQPTNFKVAAYNTTTSCKENWRTSHTTELTEREVCHHTRLAHLFAVLHSFLFEKDRYRSCREIETGVSFTLFSTCTRSTQDIFSPIMFFLLDQWPFCRAKSKVSTCDNSTYPRKGKMNMPTAWHQQK